MSITRSHKNRDRKETAHQQPSDTRERERHLWRLFAKDPSEKNHEALWRHYQPLLAFVAESFNTKQNNLHTQRELIDAGDVGLLDAIAEFSPVPGARFETLAVPLIRDAMARSVAVQKNNVRHLRRLELAEAISKAPQNRDRKEATISIYAEAPEKNLDAIREMLRLASRAARLKN